MKFSGEQFIPGINSLRLQEEHFLRYEFLKSVVNSKVVLDVACGVGYGVSVLSTNATSVTGIDVSLDAIQYAIKHYKSDNNNFIQSNCTDIPIKDQSIDVITSFETIEHLDEDERKKFYCECKRVLKSTGVIFFSTPNKRVTSPYTIKPLNRYHVLEFRKKQLIDELNNYFSVVDLMGQRHIPVFFLYKWIRKFIRLIEIMLQKELHLYSRVFSPEVSFSKRLFEPRVFVIKCKK